MRLAYILLVIWIGSLALANAAEPRKAPPVIFEHTEKTGDDAQPEIALFLRLPDGHTPENPTARGVLAFCTWQMEAASLRKAIANDSDPLVQYAKKNRLALLTWNTATLWRTGKSFDQISRSERRSQDETFDSVARAWDRGVREMCRDHGLPETGFLLYGISRGAHWSGRLALRIPERFLAVHIHVANSYEKALGSAVGPLWLVSSGDLDMGRDNALAFYRLCQSKGHPIVFKVANGLGHASNVEIERLRDAFFDYAMRVQKRDTNVPPTTGMLEDLRLSNLTGDLLTQEVYRGQAAAIVPEAQRVPLPDESLAKAWGFLRK